MCWLVFCKNLVVKKVSNENYCVFRFYIYYLKLINCGYVGIFCVSCFSKKNVMLKVLYYNYNWYYI